MSASKDFRILTETEIEHVSGGFFWIALPIVIAGGYTLGKDRALRDNARDQLNAG